MTTMTVEDAFMIKRRGLLITVWNPETEPVIGQVWSCQDVEWCITAVEKFDKFLCGVKKVYYGLFMKPSEEGKLLVRGDILTFKTATSQI